MSSPCSTCTKRCCAHYTVSVNGYDAWLIATRLRLPPASFLVYFPVAEDAERGFRLHPGGPRHEIALDKVGGFRRGNPCVFWIDLMNGRGRCGIHAVRPHVCQTYPAYQDGDVVMLRDDVLCPEGSWSLSGMDLATFRARLHAFRIEQDVYAAVVAAWNDALEGSARGRTADDYYAHLMEAYDRLAAVRQALPADEERRLVAAWGALERSAPSPLLVDPGFTPGSAAILERIRAAVGAATPALRLAANG